MTPTTNFNENGHLFLKAVFSIEKVEACNKQIRDFMQENEIYAHVMKKEDVQQDTFYVNNTYVALNSFTKMQYYYLPVIDNRACHNRMNDVGMIDIYNVNRIFPTILADFDIDLLGTLLQKITGTKWKVQRANIQICANVANPIPFHYENCEPTIKCAIYLSDIQVETDGAPVYIERTHLNGNKNTIKNADIRTFLGGKGDVLISFQNGLHRKLPQINKTTGFLVIHFIKANQ